jgi:hypothetical protein
MSKILDTIVNVILTITMENHMNATTEKKPTTTARATDKNATAGDTAMTAAQDMTTAPVSELQAVIDKLDAEMMEKLTNVIDQLVPGNSASLNTSVVKEISKMENAPAAPAGRGIPLLAWPHCPYQ